MGSLIAVKHNIEVAHRLFLLPGKCENIHGHSMWVTLYLKGNLNASGILESIEFGTLKKEFREHLDVLYDHRLLLNSDDPWARRVDTTNETNARLPGLKLCPNDPTTENIAKWIGEYCKSNIHDSVHAVDVWETSVNMARWEA